MINFYKYFNIELIRLQRKSNVLFLGLQFIFFFLFTWLRTSDIIKPDTQGLSNNVIQYIVREVSLSNFFGFFLAVWVSYEVVLLFKEKLVESFLLHGYSRYDLGAQIFNLVLIRVIITQVLILLSLIIVGFIYNENFFTYINPQFLLLEGQSLILIALFSALLSIAVPNFLMVFFIPLYFVIENYLVFLLKNNYDWVILDYAPINVFYQIKQIDSIFYIGINTIIPVCYFILIAILIQVILLKKPI